MYCYHYDPATGKYIVAIMSFLRLAGVLTLIGIMGFIFIHLRRERRQNGAVVPTATGTR